MIHQAGRTKGQRVQGLCKSGETRQGRPGLGASFFSGTGNLCVKAFCNLFVAFSFQFVCLNGIVFFLLFYETQEKVRQAVWKRIEL